MEEGDKDVRISFIVTVERRQAFKKACLELGQTMSNVLRTAVDKMVDNMQQIRGGGNGTER